jgi:hypothetical protein
MQMSQATYYGKVSAADLEANHATLNDPWDPKWKIEDLWCRIKDAQEFASDNNGDLIGDAMAIEATLTVFEKVSVYHDQVMAWRNQDNTAATLDTFRDHFAFADTEEYNRKATAQTAGYHGAHAASTTTTSPPHDVTTNKFCHTWSIIAAPMASAKSRSHKSDLQRQTSKPR